MFIGIINWFMEKMYRFLDLTHTLKEGLPVWDEKSRCKVEMSEGEFRIHHLEMDAGIGTHMDAPSHLKKKVSIEQIPLEKLIVPCRTIHVKGDENYSLSLKEILIFEAHHGIIDEGHFVLLHTGWDRFWNDPKAYRNNYKFPTYSADAAHYLAEKGIVGIGIDTLSPDLPDFPVHKILLSRGIYIVENVANASEMPSNATVAILPLKGEGLSEAPVRMVGIIPR